MSLLSEIHDILRPVGIPVETGVFSDKAPDEYIVVHEARISIFTKGNYLSIKNAVVKAFLVAEFTVTNRQYIGYEADTGYHHYNVDVANYYETEDI